VLESASAPPDFHARFSAVSRTYRYYIDPVFPGPPHTRLYTWQVRRSLQVTELNNFARLVAGTHDFTSFASANDPTPSKEKTVTCSCFYSGSGLVVFQISAKSFLWKMVRSIVGTILECVSSGKSPDDFSAIMEARDRKAAGPCAPARGLFLERVDYEQGE
ncbi:MAG: tRNA pseudouridine(38-40) synthase TruA, partial [Methanobacteriota archaeon]